VKYIVAVGLTMCITSYILYKGRKVKPFPGIVYSQSSLHMMIRDYLPKDLYRKPKRPSQMLKHIEKSTVKVIFIDEKAYWVSNNTFYCAQAVGNAVDIETTEPVDTTDMSKKDIEKMLFILDNLKNGNKDDNSSAGNERL
jgi:hypothetical protein